MDEISCLDAQRGRGNALFERTGTFCSLSLLLESFRPRPMLHHFWFWFSSPLTFSRLFACADFGCSWDAEMFVTSPSAPHFMPSSPRRDFFFFTITISPMSGSSVWST